MKMLTTTPALKTIATKGVLVAVSLLLVLAAPFQMANLAAADSYDDQMKSIQQSINQYQAQADTLNAQAQTLQSAVDALTAQIAAVQAQIQLSQTKYDQLTAQIADTEQKIKDQQDALGTTIADLYVDGQVSPVEMLASSKNISDYLDKQEYRSSIQDQLTASIKQIKDLQAQLTQQKADVQTVLDTETAQKAQIAAQEAEQQDLLTQTQGQEAAYQGLVAAQQKKLSDAAAAQRAYYAALAAQTSGGGGQGVNGSFVWKNVSPSNGMGGCAVSGYPYCQAQDSVVDPWALYNRECVSYVAWALSARFGKYVGSFSGAGNAMQWPTSAPRYSGAVRVSDPQPGDAVILPASGSFSPIGHAMIVESVSDGWVHVSQFNFYGTGQYSTMDIRETGVVFLRFHDKV